MNEALLLNLAWNDWLDLFVHILSLSMLSVGGMATILSAMQLYLVGQQGWLTNEQFNGGYAMAQAAPGPNVLYMAMFGWMIGVNSGSMVTGLFGACLMMTAMLLPCSTLAFFASRWLQQNRERLAVRAFRQGMMPVVVGLLLAAAWLMAHTRGDPVTHWPIWLTTLASLLIVWRTRLHILWLLITGGVLGWFGFI